MPNIYYYTTYIKLIYIRTRIILHIYDGLGLPMIIYMYGIHYSLGGQRGTGFPGRIHFSLGNNVWGIRYLRGYHIPSDTGIPTFLYPRTIFPSGYCIPVHYPLVDTVSPYIIP